MIEFNCKNEYKFNQVGITCLIKRVLDDDVEQFYITDDLKGLSLFEICTIQPLYNEGMCHHGLTNLLVNLNRFAEVKLRNCKPNHKTDNICQPQQYLG
jgi:hypothetical protein